jgi:hypothetical protein
VAQWETMQDKGHFFDHQTKIEKRETTENKKQKSKKGK